MIEVKGKYCKDAKIFTDNIEEEALNQVYENCDCPAFKDAKIRLMPDCHAGANCNVGFFDIVDGKQRLNALYEFLTNQFKDLHGNYFGDLSAMSKKVFADSTCFAFGIMRERSTDEDVINSFLNVNFTGTPMSREHIEYVRSLKNKIEK